jgi:hypothetical protein
VATLAILSLAVAGFWFGVLPYGAVVSPLVVALVLLVWEGFE